MHDPNLDPPLFLLPAHSTMLCVLHGGVQYTVFPFFLLFFFWETELCRRVRRGNKETGRGKGGKGGKTPIAAFRK